VEQIWATLPPPLDRADPATWVDAGEKWDSGAQQGAGWGGATAPGSLHSDVGGGREPDGLPTGGARTADGRPTTRELDDFRADGIRKVPPPSHRLKIKHTRPIVGR
jgi:hypothetical protein